MRRSGDPRDGPQTPDPGPDRPASSCGLDELEVGASGHVLAVQGDPDLRRRLLEMGFCNGALVEVIRRAPLGDPTEFRLRGYHLSLRGEQARHVRIRRTHRKTPS